ncbi:unnamed protein product [Linum trigynum]|uniref:Uncharacterized protein n=1 Tax=Linum trigynum TaxID=586398 RepID=A0AAV2E7E3_9ROSI
MHQMRVGESPKSEMITGGMLSFSTKLSYIATIELCSFTDIEDVNECGGHGWLKHQRDQELPSGNLKCHFYDAKELG